MSKVWEVKMKEELEKTKPLQEVPNTYSSNGNNLQISGVFCFTGRDGTNAQQANGRSGQ